eukprot:SAG31_NODE_429_length_15801_cov_6.878551_1_plen_208_part_00
MASADAAAAGAGQASNNDILAALNTIGTGLAAVRAKQDEQEVALTDLRAQASLTAAATTGLSARLTAVESGMVAKPADAKDEDPEEALDYVPYFDGREENPYPLRPRGVTGRPQLYPLGHGDPVYDHLRKKQNAAYHELGTLEPYQRSGELLSTEHLGSVCSEGPFDNTSPKFRVSSMGTAYGLGEEYGIGTPPQKFSERVSICQGS